MAEVKIRPALATDIPQTVLIEINANAANPVVTLPWKQHSHKYGLWLSRHLHFIEYPKKYQFLVATVPSASNPGEEEVVGFLQGATPKNMINGVGGDEEHEWNMVLPEGTNEEMFMHFLGSLRGSSKNFKTDDMWGTNYLSSLQFIFTSLIVVLTLVELESLSVSVNHQRMGIGSKLMEEWLKTVDVDGRAVYILASVKGKGMYEKHGAKEVGFLETDLSEFGVEKPYQNFNMVREGTKS